MKKFTKISLILAGIFAAIGIFCLIVAAALGFTLDTFENMIGDGKFAFKIRNICIFKEEDSSSTHSIEEDCDRLDMEFGAGELYIYYDDVDKIQIKKENVDDFEYYVEDKTLYIEAGKEAKSNTDAVLTVILPKNVKFQEADLELGASKAEVKGLQAVEVSVEVGAGNAEISGLDVKNLTAEVGVGKLSLEVTGEECDYNYIVECGIGAVQIGEQSYSGIGTTKNIQNTDAVKEMRVECGIGEVQIDFTE